MQTNNKQQKSSAPFYFLLLFPIFIFFSPVWLKGRMPIPADTIVGMYHPFRDVVWNGLTAGVPFKNFLITDAVRQQYPWRQLAFDLLQRGELPLWNPYTHAGTPLLANIQTALFYPINFLYFFIPFNTVWTIQVIAQPVLLAIFMFLFLTEIGISKKASTLGSLALALSGFSIAWLEWNTTLHTLVWLPLGLYCVEKIMKKEELRWFVLLGFSVSCIVFAGFLQTAFYALFLLGCYAVLRVVTIGKGHDRKKILTGLTAVLAIVVVVTSIQWLPTLKLINRSARSFDQGNVLERDDWFLPWQNLVQFVAPDYFGNPATLNYWGIFNYTEFVGYIGIAPLILAFMGIVSPGKRLKQTQRFFLLVLAAALLFALPNPISRFPFMMNLPLVSSAQPSRLMMIIDLSLSVLVAIGAENIFTKLKEEKTKLILPALTASLGIIALMLFGMWIVALGFSPLRIHIPPEYLQIAKRNLILPTMLFTLTSLSIASLTIISKINIRIRGRLLSVIFLLLFLLTAGDLLRFAAKFTPFSVEQYLFPDTKVINFLKSDSGAWRYMTTDARILPPNFSVVYRLQTIEGYDPIYIGRYGTLIASAQKDEPVLEPTAFHRIIRPENIDSPMYDLLNVKYVLALTDLQDEKLEKVFQEGETRIYRNMQVFPRAFVISDYQQPEDDRRALDQALRLRKSDIEETAEILDYTENAVRIGVSSEVGGMLVVSDMYYPGWSATLDGKPLPVERVLYALRGTMIPPGYHEILYRYSEL